MKRNTKTRGRTKKKKLKQELNNIQLGYYYYCYHENNNSNNDKKQARIKTIIIELTSLKCKVWIKKGPNNHSIELAIKQKIDKYIKNEKEPGQALNPDLVYDGCYIPSSCLS